MSLRVKVLGIKTGSKLNICQITNLATPIDAKNCKAEIEYCLFKFEESDFSVKTNSTGGSFTEQNWRTTCPLSILKIYKDKIKLDASDQVFVKIKTLGNAVIFFWTFL